MNSIPVPLRSPNHGEKYDDDEDNDTENDGDQRAHHSASRSGSLRAENGVHKIWMKTTHPRGRKARDALAQSVRFDCKDIDDFETNLREYLANPTVPAEHATIEFHFPATSAFLVYTRDFKRDSTTNWTSADVTDIMRRTAVSVAEVLQPTQNPKDQVVRQKAVARTIVEAVQRVDRFRYSFNNNWLSKEDQAHRFSFFCNDSTLNKGRAANGGAGTEGREHRKSVYECNGFIAVKFSVTKNNLEAHYTHIPVHKTYDERAPLPRRESKRRRMMEILDPEGLKALRDAKKQKLRETRIAAGWVPAKNGRLSKPESESNEKKARSLIWTQVSGSRTNTAQRDIAADEALQPLLDFLGSAERVTPIGDRDDEGEDASNGSGDDENVTFLGATFEPTQPVPTSERPRGHPPKARTGSAGAVDPRRTAANGEKVKKPSNNPSDRSAKSGPMLPGMLMGSIQSGAMNWEVTTPARPATEQTTRDGADKSQAQPSKQKQRNTSSKESEEGETEIQILKRRLYETEQRLLRIETEKGIISNFSTPLQPYPPPFYPQYPYYPYPLPPSHFPAATTAMPPPQHQRTTTLKTTVDEPPAQGSSAKNPDPKETAPPCSAADVEANVTNTEPATASPLSTSITDQAPIQSPAQVTPAPSSTTTSMPQWSTNPHSNVESNKQHPYGSSPVAPWPAWFPMPTRPPPPPPAHQPRAGALRYDKNSRHTNTTGNSSAASDVNLKGLFDSAMAAITRPDPSLVSARERLTVEISADMSNISAVNTPAESGRKNKSSFSVFMPPRGIANFKVSGNEKSEFNDPASAKKSKKSKTLEHSTPRSATSSSNGPLPITAQGGPPLIPYAQTSHLYPYPYPYPYPPYQHPYPPNPVGTHPLPPPGGYPPHPVHGYPPYPPPPPGYGYPAYPPYPYPPVAPPIPPETEAQRKAREQKEKDVATKTPSWATQLRDAMTGYATSTAATAAPTATSVAGSASQATTSTSVPARKDKEQELQQATLALTATADGLEVADGSQAEDSVSANADLEQERSQ